MDGQNLYMGTVKHSKPWRIDLALFRVYLQKKYDVAKAYYFLGCVNEDYQDLYDEIQEAGFILKFREHNVKQLYLMTKFQEKVYRVVRGISARDRRLTKSYLRFMLLIVDSKIIIYE